MGHSSEPPDDQQVDFSEATDQAVFAEAADRLESMLTSTDEDDASMLRDVIDFLLEMSSDERAEQVDEEEDLHSLRGKGSAD